nr:VOC family protein [Candidatus Freyarchaeota archaeon]
MIKKCLGFSIRVKDVKTVTERFGKLLGVKPVGEGSSEATGAMGSAFLLGDFRIYIIQPPTPDSPLAKVLDKLGEGIHVVQLIVDDIEKVMEEWKKEGVEFVLDKPGKYATGERFNFTRPSTTNRVMFELTEEGPMFF